MKNELVYFDLFPKVVPVGRPVTVHVKPLSRHARFADGKTCYVHVIPMDCMARDVFREVVGVELGAFPRMTWAEAMRR